MHLAEAKVSFPFGAHFYISESIRIKVWVKISGTIRVVRIDSNRIMITERLLWIESGIKNRVRERPE
jgi:hypothetical protein